VLIITGADMADEAENVEGAAEVPAESLPDNTTEPVAEATPATEEQSEPIDEKGVPLRNRAAEASRKARKMLEAEKELLSPAVDQDGDQDAAIRIVEQIAESKVMKRLEPILAKQFIMENPDAAEMIEDINRVRSQYPEVSSIDKLDVAYKIAKAERQDEIIRQQVEAESAARANTLEKATRASAEGTGQTRASADSLDKRINSASSLKELKELEAMLTR
jgi:hypothetical protein